MRCIDCNNLFEVEIPKGPKEEKRLVCPNCGSQNIKRIEGPSLSQPQCGG